MLILLSTFINQCLLRAHDISVTDLSTKDGSTYSPQGHLVYRTDRYFSMNVFEGVHIIKGARAKVHPVADSTGR